MADTAKQPKPVQNATPVPNPPETIHFTHQSYPGDDYYHHLPGSVISGWQMHAGQSETTQPEKPKKK